MGIVAGELAISALGGGYGTLALAVFTAMAAGFALGGAAEMADGLELTARALERGDDELDRQAMSSLWDLRDRLADLRRTRQASSRVVRHSLLWRARMAPVVHERENAGRLDLLGGRRLLLTRTALTMSPPEARGLAPSVRELAAAVAAGPRRSQAALTVSAALRMVATDIGAFAGVDPGQPADGTVSRRPAPAPGPRGATGR